MGEEMMETGRPVGHLGRVVKDPKSGNKFDVSELQDEENLSPAKKKHYYRHTNSQIQANGSECIWEKDNISGWMVSFPCSLTPKAVKNYKLVCYVKSVAL
ncbi:unnamed protein product [Brassica napus]|uniref:(rape) hypothetical protein n=1 Tax=Brassica napus TaxID=3708 RepID=A0A816RCE8_BRANA|nr:unnamed protein product [Brassica napus]